MTWIGYDCILDTLLILVASIGLSFYRDVSKSHDSAMDNGEVGKFLRYNHRWHMPSSSSAGRANMWYSFNAACHGSAM